MIDSFRLSVREIDDILIIDTDGYINNTAGEEIADLCKKLILSGKKKFLVNLAKSPVINSVGVSIFIEIIENLQEVNGSIGYFNLVPIVKKTFNIMGLTKYSVIYDSEEAALTALKA